MVSDPQSAIPPLGDNRSTLRFGFDSPFPERMVVGKGIALFVSGWCFHPEARITRLSITVGETPWQVPLYGLPRPDVRKLHRLRHSLESGFWGCIGLPGVDGPCEVSLTLQATLRDGRECMAHLGMMELRPHLDSEPASLPARLPRSTEPLVAIALATFNPRDALFVRQIESIRSQTHQNWVAVVVDDCSDPRVYDRIRALLEGDHRFVLYRNRSNLGFYGNFERCLSLLPREAEFVALADQDDYWYPEKIATLLEAFRPDTNLVYADMRVVTPDGKIESNTYWTRRRNNHTDIFSLLMANTVTGAASLFRREMLDYILPFPPSFGRAFHDHWAALVALALGRIDFVDRPLHDYVQHGGNVIGHWQVVGAARYVPWRDLIRLRTGRTRPREYIRSSSQDQGREAYMYFVLRLSALARTLLIRCGEHMEEHKRETLARIAALDESERALWWLVLRGLLRRADPRMTAGAERQLLSGLLWRRLMRPIDGAAKLDFPGHGPSAPSSDDLQVRFVKNKIAPFRLEVTGTAPRRVNLIVPTLDVKHFFGGRITIFALARRLAEDGLRVRVVTVDPLEEAIDSDASRPRSATGLLNALQVTEIAERYDRSDPLQVSPEDTFIATAWWTAHIAHAAAQRLDGRPFVYLIQEYSPCVHPTGTLYELARESYEFPHYALFSTEILREYFRHHRIGVYAGGLESGERLSTSFQNPITKVGPVETSALARPTRRLLFYARPEEHAARNMFEMGVLALTRLVADGCFDSQWEFFGVGRVSGPSHVTLGDGVTMRLLGRLGSDDYRDLLLACDLGLALQDSPHPGLLPIEMASAGMVTVTNSFDTKGPQHFAAISSNIITAEPTIAGVAAGLREALGRIDDVTSRAAGSAVEWSRDAESSFDAGILHHLREFLNDPTRVASTPTQLESEHQGRVSGREGSGLAERRAEPLDWPSDEGTDVELLALRAEVSMWEEHWANLPDTAAWRIAMRLRNLRCSIGPVGDTLSRLWWLLRPGRK